MPGLHRILILVIMKKKAVEYKISATKQDFSIAKLSLQKIRLNTQNNSILMILIYLNHAL